MTIELWIILAFVLALSLTVFFGLILLGYKANKNLDKGEMRRAIAGFVILLFGLVAIAGFFPTGVVLPAEIKGLFAGMVTTIVGFYFGSRSSSP